MPQNKPSRGLGSEFAASVHTCTSRLSPMVFLVLLGISLGVTLWHFQQHLAQRNLELQVLLQQVHPHDHAGLDEIHSSFVPSSSASQRVPAPVAAQHMQQGILHDKQQEEQMKWQQEIFEGDFEHLDESKTGRIIEKKPVPDIFVGVFTTFDTAAALAAEAWAVKEEGAADNKGEDSRTSDTNADEQSHSSITLHRPSDSKLRYAYRLRRQAMRMTWFPMGSDRLEALERELGVMMRFVVGTCGRCGEQAEAMETALDEESRQYGDIMRLHNHVESYHSLASKTRAFFVSLSKFFLSDEGLATFSPRQLREEESLITSGAKTGKVMDLQLLARMPRWIVKVDDDVYLQTQRLMAASLQWSRMGAEYVGCMKHGHVFSQPGLRWREPQHQLIGNTYYMHAYGSVYGISGHVVKEVIAQNADNLRLLANEDTSVGLWMVSHQVQHFEDMRLCVPGCHPAAVAILRNECAGLCDPIHDLVSAHNVSACRKMWDWRTTGYSQLKQGGHVIHPEDLSAKGKTASNPTMHTSQSDPGASAAQSSVQVQDHSDLDVGIPKSERTHEWNEMVQVTPGEMPYLPSYPEHTEFESMWV